jgi:hypothetical protein
MMKTKIFLFATILWMFIGCNKSDDFTQNDHNGKSGSITRFAIWGSYMYVLDQNRIIVYDIAQSDQPRQVNIIKTDYGLETIVIYDGVIYVGSRDALYILDITVPHQPVVLSKTDRELSLQGGCDPVVVKDNYAYSTVKIIQNICGNIAAQSQLIVYDISNKNKPLVVATVPMHMPNGLGYKENYLFVCDEGSDQIEIFDISVPASIYHYGYVDLIDPVDLIVNQNKMIVSTKSDFYIFDITDINQIKKIGIIPKS